MAISGENGREAMLSLEYVDDGVQHAGGVTCGLIGSLGSGKSTLLTQLGQFIRSVDGSKYKYVHTIMQGETPSTKTSPVGVLWRGRPRDFWINLIPENWMRSFPNYRQRPKNVHVYRYFDDDLTFDIPEDGTDHADLLSTIPTPRAYTTCESLYKMVSEDPGGIHVIYEPHEYILRPEIVRRLLSSTMEIRRHKEDYDEPLPARPELWWYEFFDFLLANKKNEHWAIFADEGHELCPFSASGLHWHAVEHLSTAIIDMRKSNVSFFLSTHHAALVNWQILDRLVYFAWMPGSLPMRRFSMVKPAAVRRFTLGSAIIEQRQRMFGAFTFGRIENQAPLLRATVNGPV